MLRRIIVLVVVLVLVEVWGEERYNSPTPKPLSSSPSFAWKQIITNVRKLQNQGRPYDALSLLEEYQYTFFPTGLSSSLLPATAVVSSSLVAGSFPSFSTVFGTNPLYLVEYLEQYAELLDLVKNYTLSIRVRESLIYYLREQTSSSSVSQAVPKFETILKAYIQLIDSYNHNFQYQQALTTLQYLYTLVDRNTPGFSSSSSSTATSTTTPHSIVSGLQRIEAQIKDCQSTTATFSAFLLYCKSLGYTSLNRTVWYTAKYSSLLPYYPSLTQPSPLLTSPGQRKLAQEYLQLLHRVIATENSPVASIDEDHSSTYQVSTDDPILPTSSTTNRTTTTPKRIKNKYFLRNLYSLLNHTTNALLLNGPYEYRDQLPRTYIPGLTSQPWHSYYGNEGTDPSLSPHRSSLYYDEITGYPIPIRKSYPELFPLVEYLRTRIPLLKEEYYTLKNIQKDKHQSSTDLSSSTSSSSLLQRETECIHDASNGVWYYYIPTGYWLRNKDAHNCSLDTPVACEVIRNIPSYLPSRVRLLRTGYSSIQNRTYLRPHYGLTNTQLKLHLSLIVPTTQEHQQPCSYLTVGNYTRTWSEDPTSTNHILFFDDSYIHHVVHRCTEERVIFQIVLSHPDIESIDEYNDVLPYSNYH